MPEQGHDGLVILTWTQDHIWLRDEKARHAQISEVPMRLFGCFP